MAKDFCKIVIVDERQCLIQIVTKEDGFGLSYTTESKDLWVSATVAPIPTIEKARELLEKSDEKICKEIITDTLAAYEKGQK